MPRPMPEVLPVTRAPCPAKILSARLIFVVSTLEIFAAMQCDVTK
jgi:hypothetical protein